MRLHIGVVTEHTGWRTLLQQEGVPFSFLSSADELDPRRLSAVIVHRTPPPFWKDALAAYLRRGGALLMSGEAYLWLFGRNGRRKYIRYVLPEHGSAFWHAGLIDLFVRGTIVSGASMLTTDSALVRESVGDGVVVTLPIDAGELVLDRRWARKSFYHTGGRLPAEHVSLVSKGGLRKLVSAALEWLHHQRRLPYCHLWYFPDEAESIFGLRVDTDFASQEEVEQLHKFAEDAKLKMSWFLHTKSHEQWLSRFAKMDGHEMGVHCDEHVLLKSYEGTRRNLAQARNLMERHGMSPIGFSAPFGFWTEEQARAVEEMRFAYSSEFSLDYDNLPSFPTIMDRPSSVLQVPVHPVCIGTFRRCRSTDEEMMTYFERVIAWKRATNEPLLFYHHPNDGHLPVLKSLLELASQKGIKRILLKDLDSWWRKRVTTNYIAEIDGERVVVKGSAESDLRVRVTKPDLEALVPLGCSIDLDSIVWRRKASPIALPADVERIRAFSARRYFDFIQVQSRRRSV